MLTSETWVKGGGHFADKTILKNEDGTTNLTEVYNTYKSEKIVFDGLLHKLRTEIAARGHSAPHPQFPIQ